MVQCTFQSCCEFLCGEINVYEVFCEWICIIDLMKDQVHAMKDREMTAVFVGECDKREIEDSHIHKVGW